MKIALASDVHLEFGDLEFTNEGADVLVLAGDIMIAQYLYDHTADTIQRSIDLGNKLGDRQKEATKYRGFLERASSQFKHVISLQTSISWKIKLKKLMISYLLVLRFGLT